MKNEKKPDWFLEWIKKLTLKQKITYSVILIFGIPLISAILSLISPSSKVSPCDCADVASKAEIIGYNNLSDSQQSLYRICEDKYTTSGDAYNDCVNGMINK
jgi:uncharacterized membrane protein YqhA